MTLRFHMLILAVGLIATGIAISTSALDGERLSDPYHVLERHYDAIGGLERLRAEGSTHFEGTLTTPGLSGPIEHWHERRGRSRTWSDLGGSVDLRGDNGEVAWVVDRNGKLRIERDERALRLRELDRRLERFEHLDRDSDVFAVAFEGMEKVNGSRCYVVSIASTLDDAVTLRYFDTSTLLETKRSVIRGDRGSHTLYSDYRSVNGVMKAFRLETTAFPAGRTRVTAIERYETDIDIDPSLFEPPREGDPGFTFAGGGSVEIPFELIEGHIYLPVTIDGDRRLWLLDSGAGRTVIDKDYAAELGLELIGGGKAAGAAQSIGLQLATIPRCSLPGLELAGQEIVTMEIADLFRRASDVQIGGLLGHDFLSRFVSRIDYANSTITLYDPLTFVYSGDGVVVDAPLVGTLLTAPVSLGGSHSGRCMIDLGTSINCLHYPFADERGPVGTDGVEMVGAGEGGAFNARLSRLEEIEFCGHTVRNPVVLVPTDGAGDAFGTTDLVATLGYGLLRHFVVTLDYGRQKIIVERGADFGRTFPEDKSGLAVRLSESGDPEVFFVMPGTPADESGLARGDVIVSIDGIPVEDLEGLSAIRRLFEGAAGSHHVLSVRRSGRVRDLSLTLRRYL
jgi:hypothetical protein